MQSTRSDCSIKSRDIISAANGVFGTTTTDETTSITRERPYFRSWTQVRKGHWNGVVRSSLASFFRLPVRMKSFDQHSPTALLRARWRSTYIEPRNLQPYATSPQEISTISCSIPSGYTTTSSLSESIASQPQNVRHSKVARSRLQRPIKLILHLFTASHALSKHCPRVEQRQAVCSSSLLPAMPPPRCRRLVRPTTLRLGCSHSSCS